MDLRMRRAYEPAETADGYRVLVDRLWPRGVSKEDAALDASAKELAPTPELRNAWHHGEVSWEEFAAAYRRELAENPALTVWAARLAEHPVTTLVYGAKDPVHNHVVVLREALQAAASAGP